MTEGSDREILTLLSGRKGNFSSPRYPSKYPEYSTKEWQISVPRNHVIKLEFQTFLLLQQWYRPHCLEFRRGKSRCSPLLFTFCGKRIVSPLYVQGKHLWIGLKALWKGQAVGFHATYETVSPSSGKL